MIPEGVTVVPNEEGPRPSVRFASSASNPKSNLASGFAWLNQRTVGDDADGRNGVQASIVRVNSLKSNEETAADDTDANHPPQSAPKRTGNRAAIAAERNPAALMAVPDPLICEKTGVSYSSTMKERRNQYHNVYSVSSKPHEIEKTSDAALPLLPKEDSSTGPAAAPALVKPDATDFRASDYKRIYQERIQE